MSVVLHHIFFMFPPMATATTTYEGSPIIRLLKYSPLHIIWAGHEAVILFFVLSGFVLFLPYSRRTALSPRAFVLRRALRIYPPTIACIIALVVCSQLGMYPLRHITGPDVINSMLLIGRRGDVLYPPLWSLIHEARISLVFPMLAAAVMRQRLTLVIAVMLGISLTVFAIMRAFPIPLVSDDDSVVQTMLYLPSFVTGMLLAKYRTVVTERYTSLTNTSKAILLLVSTLLYTAPYTPLAEISKMRGLVFTYASTVGSAFFIVISLSSGWVRSALLLHPLRNVGRVSFSLYLFHSIVVGVLFFLLEGVVPHMLIAVGAFVVAMATAFLMFTICEAPSIRLAKRLGRRQGA